MKIKEIIGIDVSKSELDVCIHSSGKKNKFKNELKGFDALQCWVEKNNQFLQAQTVFVFEHTGLYSNQLTEYCDSQNLQFCLLPGLEIKRSLGLVRGKSDQIDAERIARYGYRIKDELVLSKADSLEISQVKSLMSLRNTYVKQRAGHKARLGEQKRVLTKKYNKVILASQAEIIRALDKEIGKIENEISQVIKSSAEMNKIYNLLISIKGIGKQTATALIVYTSCFTKFKTWRKFASYCGIAPFPYKSGSSIKGRTKVSNLANKHMKSLFQMCATSAIQFNREMKQYYERRVKEGKNKMSTLNIIRNKLLSRAFAVVKRQSKYVDTLLYNS